jgi:putative membrane protein
VNGASAWAFHPHPDVLLVVCAALAFYAFAWRRWGRLFHPQGRAVTGKQATLYTLGILAFFLAVGWPIHDLAERYLYSAHMLQHLLLGFALPPLVYLGTPEWLARMVIGRGLLGRLYRRASRPLLAGIVFNVALALIHWPAVVDLMLRNRVFHESIHLVFVGAAFLMWAPVCSPLPEVRARLTPIGKMGFLFAQTILPTVPASFLTFGERALYPRYATFPRLFGLSPVDDMQLAGLIMKLGGGLFLWSIIAVMFFRWAAREDADVLPDIAPTPGSTRA